MTDIIEQAMKLIERADKHPHGGENAARDLQTAALLLCAHHLRRIADALKGTET